MHQRRPRAMPGSGDRCAEAAHAAAHDDKIKGKLFHAPALPLRLYTIPIALTNFIEESVTEYNLVMAASASALLPVFIVFLAGQKFFVKGLMAGAVKG